MKELKKVTALNAALLIAVLMLNVYKIIFLPLSPLKLVDALGKIAALVFGLIYVLRDYRKKAAGDYKGYLTVLLLSGLLSFSADILSAKEAIFSGAYLSTILVGFSCILIVFLLLIKDLGKSKSLIIAYLNIAAAAVVMIRSLVLYSAQLPYLVTTISGMLLAVITLEFVYAKYADKASRGSK